MAETKSLGTLMQRLFSKRTNSLPAVLYLLLAYPINTGLFYVCLLLASLTTFLDREMPLGKRINMLQLFLFLQFAVVICLASIFRADALDGFWAYGRYFVVILALPLSGKFLTNGNQFERFLKLCSIMILALVAVLLLEVLYQGMGKGQWNKRANAFTNNPLVVALLLMPLMFWTLYGVRTEGRQRWIHVVAFASALLAIPFLMGARMSFLVTLAYIPIAFLIMSRRFGVFLILAGSGIIGVVCLVYFDLPLGSRFSSLFTAIRNLDFETLDYSMQSRLYTWVAALEAISHQPYLGYGAQNTTSAIGAFLPQKATPLAHAHNQYLTFLLIGGVPGLISGCLFLFSPLLLTLMSGQVSMTRSNIHLAASLALPISMVFLTDSLFSDTKVLFFYSAACVLVQNLVATSPSPQKLR